MKGEGDVLWHYTNVEGFHGIVSSQRLRLADARFLNDRTERRFGTEILEQVLDKVSQSNPLPFLDSVRAELQSLPETNLFVCSFSANNNSMSQWERYAERGYGYCLGFDQSKIEHVLKDDVVELKEIVYLRSRQREMTEKLLKQLLRDFRNVARGNTSEETAAVAAATAATLLRALTLQFKNPAFRDEKEWRLIRELRRRGVYFLSSDQVAFARRGGFIKPYLEVALSQKRDADTPSLPLVSVICGPKLERELATESAAYFLRRNGYVVPVEHSKLSEIWR